MTAATSRNRRTQRRLAGYHEPDARQSAIADIRFVTTSRPATPVPAAVRKLRMLAAFCLQLFLVALIGLFANLAYVADAMALSSACTQVNNDYGTARTITAPMGGRPHSPDSLFDPGYMGFAKNEVIRWTVSSTGDGYSTISNNEAAASISAYSGLANTVLNESNASDEFSIGLNNFNVSGQITLAGTEASPQFGLVYDVDNEAGGNNSLTLQITCSGDTTASSAPVANAVSATVAANSSTNPVTLHLSGGAATSVAVTTAAAHGTATATGTSITYTPTAGYSGADSFAYTATNAIGTSTAATVTVTVSAPTLAMSPAAGALTKGTVGTAYSQTVSPSQGTAPYSFSVSGSLPTGLSFNTTTGTISGTPTASGSFSFTITATDAHGASGTAAYTLDVAAQAAIKPDVTGNSVKVPYNAVDFNVPLLLSGGPADYVTVTGTAMLQGTATVSGTKITYTPNRGFAGTNSFTYTATNAFGTSKVAIVTIMIDPPTPVLAPAAGALPAGKIGETYSQSITASEDKLPYTYSLKTGALPAGLTLDTATGLISGTPTALGKADFTFEVKDGFASRVSGAYSISIIPPAPTISSISPATGETTGGTSTTISGHNFTGATVVTFGGTTATFTVVNDTTITATTPARSAGAATIAITTAGGTATLTNGFTYTLAKPVSGAVSATVAANSSSNPITLSLSGGEATSVSVTWAATHGTATAAGTSITYTPTAGYSGPDGFAYAATNASGTSAPAVVTITVSAPTLAFVPAGGDLPAGKIGKTYNQTITASGGNAPYEYAVTAGTLPAGLTLDPTTGRISGTPSKAAAANFTITATDVNGSTGTASYSLDINSETVLVLNPAGGNLPPAMAGEAYATSVSVIGADGPVIYKISGGLPDGVVFNVSTGTLTGPLKADAKLGDYSIKITATDRAGATGSATFTLTVVEQTITAADKEVTVPAGSAPNNVYLNREATGGPFTDARIAFVNPAQAGTAEIVEGELAAASGFAPVGYYLKFTPKPSFNGTAVVGYTLTSAIGTSNTGNVTYHIGVGADETAEQIDSMTRGFVRSRQNLLSTSIKLPGLLDRRRATSASEPVTTSVSPSARGANLSFSTSLAQIRAARDAAETGGKTAEPDLSPFNIWVNGTLLFHNREDNGDKWGSFALFSTGADYLLGDKALIGLSFHYDRMTDPTDADAKLTGNGWLAGPYASFEIGRGVFLDTTLLYGGSANDIDTRTYDGTFDTRRWMSDTSLKGQWMLDEATTLTPKLRVAYFNERVDDYSVSDGASVIGLNGFTQEQLRLSAGFGLDRTYMLENGLKLMPTVGANVGYSALDGDGLFGTLSAGLTLSNDFNWDIDFSLLFNVEGDGQKSAGGKVGVNVRF